MLQKKGATRFGPGGSNSGNANKGRKNEGYGVAGLRGVGPDSFVPPWSGVCATHTTPVFWSGLAGSPLV